MHIYYRLWQRGTWKVLKEDVLRYDHIELDSNGILWTTLSECAPAKATYCTCNLNRLKYLADILLFDLKDASWLVLRLLNMSHLSNKISSLLCSGYVIMPFQMRVSNESESCRRLRSYTWVWLILGLLAMGDGRGPLIRWSYRRFSSLSFNERNYCVVKISFLVFPHVKSFFFSFFLFYY